MRQLWKKKEYIIIGIVVILFAAVSVMSLSSIKTLQGNARVVNYVGIVRGATQKLMKEELMGWVQVGDAPDFAEESEWYPNDALVSRLDSIIEELLTGIGPNDLIVLQDEEYLANMRQVQSHWWELKQLILDVRNGEDPQELFDSSQEYFELVNTTVFSAEAYSEEQVARINRILLGFNSVLLLILAASGGLYIRGKAVKQRADALGKIAYIDPLTRIKNRASCDRYVDSLQEHPPENDVLVIMFDMNDLKQTNDVMGHKSGDRLIADFARILQGCVGERGFVGRLGGDEFLAIIQDADASVADEFLLAIKENVLDYNALKSNALEHIHYAAGYVVDNLDKTDINDIIHYADNAMYQNKRLIKQRKAANS